ncbi:MAG: phosphate-starvation-inducible PsiE family protein [Pseudomonadota bacterium]
MIKFLDQTYDRFSAGVAAILLIGVLVVVVLAAFSFMRLTFEVAITNPLDTSYVQLQGLFDLLLGAIIALELAHSVHLMVAGKRGFAQVRIVLIIGILAVVRKLIVIEVDQVSSSLLLGLAAAIIALGSIFALLLWLDRQNGGVPQDD